MTAEERQLLMNQLEYLRYRHVLPSQIGQKPNLEPLFNHPMNVLATKALFEMGAKQEPETMPIKHLMVLALADRFLGHISQKKTGFTA